MARDWLVVIVSLMFPNEKFKNDGEGDIFIKNSLSSDVDEVGEEIVGLGLKEGELIIEGEMDEFDKRLEGVLF